MFSDLAVDRRDEGQQTDHVPPDVLMALALAIALRERREREMEEEVEDEEEEEDVDSMMADARSPDLALSDSDAFSQDSFDSKSSYVSCESGLEPVADEIAADLFEPIHGGESASSDDKKPLQKEQKPFAREEKPKVSPPIYFPSNDQKPGGESTEHKVFSPPADLRESSVPLTPPPLSPKLRRSPRNHRSSVEPDGAPPSKKDKKVTFSLSGVHKLDRDLLSTPADQRDFSASPTPSPERRRLPRNCQPFNDSSIEAPSPPSDVASEEDAAPTDVGNAAKSGRKRGRPPKQNKEIEASSPRIAKIKTERPASAQLKLTRRDFDHRRADKKVFWTRLIGVQVEWMRKLCTETFNGAEIVGFTVDSWDLLTKAFSWLKNVRSTECHQLAMTFLANSIKIYELLTVRGFEEVFSAVLDFMRGVLKKYLSFPKKMNEVDLRWIQAREAIRMVLNHLTQKELLLTAFNTVVELQQRFLATWTTTEEPPAETEMAFVCYGVDQLTSFVSSINCRIQQAQRIDVYGLGF